MVQKYNCDKSFNFSYIVRIFRVTNWFDEEYSLVPQVQQLISKAQILFVFHW